MSVFTSVTEPDLAAWLQNYAIGRLAQLQGISAGVQNSNFFVTTSLGRYVLTLFETMPRAELPFYLHLMAHLARHGLPVPAPIANRDNEYLGTLSGKPAVLVSRLAGKSDMAPDVARCTRIGAMLALLPPWLCHWATLRRMCCGCKAHSGTASVCPRANKRCSPWAYKATVRGARRFSSATCCR